MRTRMSLFAVNFVILFTASVSSADLIAVSCPAGSNLNDCVRQACANPGGGVVYLEAASYDANLKAALTIESFEGVPNSVGLCKGGVTLAGSGIGKTILVSTGPNLVQVDRATGPQTITYSLAAVSLGSPFGVIDGHVEVRDLTVRCEAPSTCPTSGVALFFAGSAAMTGVRIEGFRSGAQLASDNLVATRNVLLGRGAAFAGGRGIRGFDPFQRPFTGASVTANLISGFERGAVMDSIIGLDFSANELVNVGWGALLQRLAGEVLVDGNRIDSTTFGLVYNFNPDGAASVLSHNLVCGSATGIVLAESLGLVVERNKLLGVPDGAALVFDLMNEADSTLTGNVHNPASQCSLSSLATGVTTSTTVDRFGGPIEP
jgi:hypothetical protein